MRVPTDRWWRPGAGRRPLRCAVEPRWGRTKCPTSERPGESLRNRGFAGMAWCPLLAWAFAGAEGDLAELREVELRISCDPFKVESGTWQDLPVAPPLLNCAAKMAGTGAVVVRDERRGSERRGSGVHVRRKAVASERSQPGARQTAEAMRYRPGVEVSAPGRCAPVLTCGDAACVPDTDLVRFVSRSRRCADLRFWGFVQAPRRRGSVGEGAGNGVVRETVLDALRTGWLSAGEGRFAAASVAGGVLDVPRMRIAGDLGRCPGRLGKQG